MYDTWSTAAALSSREVHFTELAQEEQCQTCTCWPWRLADFSLSYVAVVWMMGTAGEACTRMSFTPLTQKIYNHRPPQSYRSIPPPPATNNRIKNQVGTFLRPQQQRIFMWPPVSASCTLALTFFFDVVEVEGAEGDGDAAPPPAFRFRAPLAAKRPIAQGCGKEGCVGVGGKSVEDCGDGCDQTPFNFIRVAIYIWRNGLTMCGGGEGRRVWVWEVRVLRDDACAQTKQTWGKTFGDILRRDQGSSNMVACTRVCEFPACPT